MFHGKVILLVDDEPDLREILRNELEFLGAQIWEAANGKDAMELLQREKVDVVISDIRMPGGDGAALARQIRQQHPVDPRLILITGFADLQIPEALDLGADAYISKPFRLSQLKEAVLKALESPDRRWIQSPQPQANSYLKIPMSLNESLARGLVHFGRGGFFLKSQSDLVHTGDLIEVSWENTESLQALVRWVRGPLEDWQNPGMALELAYVPPQLKAELDQLIPDWQSRCSFIPQNSR